MDPIVIVGAGLAGGTAATALRKHGHTGPITLIGAEEHPPYERPPLSKKYLMSKSPFAKAEVHPAGWYERHDVETLLGTEVQGLDLAARTVTAGDREIRYDKLVLATGSRPRHLDWIDEADFPHTYLRTVEDADAIKPHLRDGASISVIGAGWIGLEVTAAAREAGASVTLFDTAAVPLERVLGSELGEVFATLHRDHGVDLRMQTPVTPADLRHNDLTVVGVGITPDTRLAEQAGLAVDNGILVDATLRTSDPHVWAIGDVANHDHPVLGRLRVEHWDNAIEQARAVAPNLLGAGDAYERLPYFFSDQYDLGMEYVGHAGPDATVEFEGDVKGLKFTAWFIDDGRIAAGMHVNDWDAIDEIRDRVGKPWSSD